MNLQSTHQLQVTRDKLQILEEEYQRASIDRDITEHVRELTLRSLKKFINQVKEEIARFESRMATGQKNQH